MKYRDYFENTRRTWNVLPVSNDNIQHALLGMIDEVGELAKQYKSNLAYGKPLLVEEGEGCIKEEIGDLFYFATRLIDEMKFEEVEKIKTALQLMFDEDFKEKVEKQKEVTPIGACLFVAGKTGIMYTALHTQDGNLVVTAVKELMYGLCILSEMHNLNVEDVLESNINKLRVRFPDKFSNENASNRDKVAEMKAVKGGDDGK